jgi:Protein of unknown function (DUF1360)
MTVTDETRDRTPETNASKPPYAAYAGIMSTFAGVVGLAGVLVRRLGRDPRCDTTPDLAVLAVATFKVARTVSRDDVTSFIRAPFVEGEAGTGEAEEPVATGRAPAGHAGKPFPPVDARRPRPPAGEQPLSLTATSCGHRILSASP